MHKKYKITFRVKTKELPDGDQIYIVGSHDLLGCWRPGAVPLIPDKNGNGYWERTFTLRNRADIEYKFTRGSWETEAVDAEGKPLGNFHLHVEKDEVLTIEIANWRDLIKTPDDERVTTRITGTVEYHKSVEAPGLLPRDIVVWLPKSYEKALEKRYPVLYMHDGQNVFDPVTSYTGVDWQADETATKLIAEGRMREIVIVGVYNTIDRLEEYSTGAKGQKYREFLIHTLKPFIDKTYRTLPEREHTATIGSSMGGLVSFLLAWFHSETFGKASCLSPSFIFRKNHAIKLIKKSRRPRHKVRVYMDCGGVGGDALLHKGCKKVLRILRCKGYWRGRNIYYSYYRRARHSEVDWAKRLWRHFLFLFGKNQ